MISFVKKNQTLSSVIRYVEVIIIQNKELDMVSYVSHTFFW